MRAYLRIALGAFLLAALTGVLLRFGLFMGMPQWAQNFNAVRHAHSHLMYFGWGTLAIMALIWHLLPRYTQAPPPRAAHWQMGILAPLALLSLPAFWRNGYGPTSIGGAELPLGAMVSGLNGILWLVFVGLYWRATRHITDRPLPLRLWDWALVLLLVAFGGALGLMGTVLLDVSNVFLSQAFLHLFLELFATGWFTLALLGLLWAWVEQQNPQGTAPQPQTIQRLPTLGLALAIAPTFFLGMSPALVPPHIFWLSAGANLIAALLLAWHVGALWQQRGALPRLAQVGLVALSLHLLLALALIWPGVWRWSAATQLRIFYLHNLLLGWMSSGLLGLALAVCLPVPRQRAARLLRHALHATWIGGVGLMLVALVGLGMLGIVAPFSALTLLRMAAWSSVVIVIAVSLAFARALMPARASTPVDDRRATPPPIGTSSHITP